jgi:D-glycero-alpha-D-manno-heptose 1-phosphate guanylyltransferase
MEAIVLAGGFGTRLASRLNGVPKPMAPVDGRPFLEIVLNELKVAGFTRVLLSVGHLYQVIEGHFGESFDGMQLEYVIESIPLGTGGAIRAALEHATEETVFVINGDTFLKVDYKAMLALHKSRHANVTIAVTSQDDIGRYGEVVIAGDRIVGFREKGRSGPGWINGGVYALPSKMRWPEELPEVFSFETGFLVEAAGRLNFIAYETKGVFLDIGVPEDLDRAQTMFSRSL